MQIVEAIARVLAFRTLPTTVLTITLYAALFLAILYTDEVPAVPKDQRGLNLTEAYADLHHITAHPHPFLSHANDQVHSFVLERVTNIAKHYPHVEVVDDVFSNASWPAWSGTGAVVYNEATNVLVRVEGIDSTKPGVLFSAHYDSVSTASGTTDDGMGVATLIQLVEYFAKNRPTRTAIFNINNGEEDGLNGAFVFLKHPWANLTDSFLNLEGAAAGGRPLLFRGTSTPALRAFYVPHPHGNVLSADAFARGVVRSGTDYTVYTGFGMDGLDLAFYKGRSKYHTKYDAIPHTLGQEAALWAMMESAQSSGSALLNSDKTHGGGAPPVYFDLFGSWLVVMPLHYLYIANIFLLVVGPLVLVVLVVVEAAILRGGREAQNGQPPSDQGFFRRAWTTFVSFDWVKGVWIWAKFWVGVAVSIALQALLVAIYLRFNPYIVYSRPSIVVASSFTLAYLSLVFVITPASNHLPEKQKHVMLLQTYILTWILLVLSTVAVDAGIGGVYFITAWNAAIWLACLIGSIENMVGAQGSRDPPHRFFRRVRYAALPQRDDAPPVAEAEGATETTPLIYPGAQVRQTQEESGAIGWWMLQLALAVGVPVTLVAHISVLLVAALAQTLSDGSPASTVYRAISALVFMMVLPVVPFTFKVHSFVATTCIVVFVITTFAGLSMFPFSAQEPLKVFFQQTVALGDVSSPNAEIKLATSTLFGAEKPFVQDLLKKIPSALETSAELQCVARSTTRLGLVGCSWESELLPLPSPGDGLTGAAAARWLTASATRLGPTSARFVLAARNSRGCRVSFTNRRVKSHFVHGSDGGMLPLGSSVSEGYADLRLWSREWERPFTVDVEWEGEGGLQGVVACSWAEYASGSIGIDGTGRIPAFEELVTFLPTWAAVTKQAEGLVEASYTYSV
ncbi:Peptide hydrolase [Mycena indigotica]|uniref:Peptide hydrolase n=1 Tax=Mycena indigotica TaxID=2126181 RepID=A0A8H6VVL1_9AGAR|nr:Peptide hydrolase [Mycena indigotica]KAF7295517.1 Peptide hydrolase [Mycena indigotica]